jgi:hypothetical protein
MKTGTTRERLGPHGKMLRCPWPVKCAWEEDVVEDYFEIRIKKALVKKEAHKAALLIQTFKILFPDRSINSDVSMFKVFWATRQYGKAIRIYRKMGSPVHFAQKVGEYYERSGQRARAMVEYERRIREYYKMKILPLPGGPVELFKLGRWYAGRDARKARKYLTTYLRAGKGATGRADSIRHAKQAEALLKEMSLGVRRK